MAMLAGAACSAAGARRETPPPLPPTQPVSGTIVGSAVQFDLRPLGFVPSDGVTLPLLSPDGRHMAVQTGVAPDLATALARSGQRSPLASRIAMYRVDGRALVRLGETDGGLILGRSADNRGFLVESVRPDGARWIGRVDWMQRETEWLVQDGNVNAFAALGPDGMLVHCARGLNERMFDLVVRGGPGSEGQAVGRDAGGVRRLSGNGTRSYLLPSVSEDGGRVFALSLRDGILELLSADPSSDASLAQSAARFFVTDRGSDELALFMCSAQGARDGVDGRDWMLFHRALGSLARWNETDGLRIVPGGVLARAEVKDGREAVLVGAKVRVRTPDSNAATEGLDPGTVVLEQLGVPRALGTVEGAPAIVVFVPEQGGVRMLLIRLTGR
jgi:hypothetical protein